MSSEIVRRSPRALRRTGTFLLALLSVPVAMILVDVFIDKGTSFLDWAPVQWGIWATGLAWDISAWVCLCLVLATLARSASRIARAASLAVVVASATVHSAAIAVSAGYHAVFHHLPNVHALEFMINERQNAWSMFLDAFTIWGALWFSISIPLLVLAHLAGRTACGQILSVRGPATRRILVAIPVLVALGVSSFALGWNRFQEPLPLAAAWSRVFFQYGLQAVGNRTDLQRPVRMPLGKPSTPPLPINVLVILNESVRADAMEVLPESLKTGIDAHLVSPRSLEWQSDSLTWVFPRARSNATSTAVSVSSWTTGVPPWGSTYQIHRSPTLWDAAHGVGRRTFLLTAQDWHWWHLDEFFFGQSLDRVLDRNAFAAPRVNDLGIDDTLLVDSLASLASDTSRPFVGVLQFNATHGPFYAPDHPEYPGSSRERYLASISYVDRVQDACLAALRRVGALDRTLVIVVSDHAENLGDRDIARINCFYEEAVRIPFWIRLPRQGMDLERVRAALQAWRSRNVDLLDLAPTIMDVLGYAPGSPERSLQVGSSLLSPPPDTERVLGGQSTGDVRAWDIEGGYALKGDMKFVMHAGHGPALFDLSTDPRETTNLWGDASRKSQALSWLRPFFRLKGRSALCRRTGNDCPAELRDLEVEH